ncbi:general negative regulator of transcription subunit 5 [Kluyveromyces marxianus]|nr:general negative regulator of transcription subunit 5 [Kluyveromyces marxianus]
MSQRKLQQEVDKVLKKVKEGLEEYEEIYEKFQNTESDNQSYREKLESDLKREIKKLQKHREQIKNWLSKDDIKDRADVLMENRRLIESGMERFKSIEKIMKTKKFSTEALTNPDLIKDPRELKKRDQFLFVEECLEELQKQLDAFEVENNEEQIEKHTFHISNLENILKLLQNDDLDPETVQDFQEDIRYYVDNNDDPDFVDYDTIYQDMGCEIQPEDLLKEQSTPSKPKRSERSPRKKASPAPASLKSSTSSPRVTATSTVPSAQQQQESDNQDNASGAADTSDAATAAATAAAAAASNSSSAQNNDTNNDEKDNSNVDESNNASSKGTDSPSSAAVAAAVAATNGSAQSAGSTSATQTTTTPTTSSSTKSKKDKEPTPIPQAEDLPPPKDLSQEIEEILAKDLENKLAFKDPLFKEELPYWLETKKKLIQPPKEIVDFTLKHLESSLLNCPDSLDADTPRLFENPLSLPHPTSIFFPHEPIRFMAQDLPAKGDDLYGKISVAKIMSKFALDTLFFIFYHYQGSYDQFLASRELSLRGWKFNKVNHCWFHKEVEKLPPGIEGKEEVTWRYFDYQKAWLSRRCGADFEYKEEEFEKLW